MNPGRLIVVGTPIGNLSDISPRACQALATADPRHTGLLLQHLGLKKPFLSYQKFNEASRESEILDRLRAGETIALVTDSGMPGVSDPGERIIRAVNRENLPVEVIPGPSAVLHALIASGLPFPLEARICVARELTKMFEEVFVGTPTEAAAKFSGKTKGEITLVLSPLAPALTSSSGA